MQAKKASSSIGRVKCVVNSCYYNDQKNHCLAEEIEIQPPNARDIETTDCATFRTVTNDTTGTFM
ncbi:MAG: DUF1540 domain-containing protein [Syntrophomonadaceae bacterium]|nr:DUF1540 domain-containing protein [Syntrophomonadaceae bacterium]